MQITYYGHSCFGVEVSGKQLLFDPFISGNDLAKHIEIKNIPADYVLISHGHGDHIMDGIDIAKRTNAKVISNYEICTIWFELNGISNVHGMNHGGSWTFDFGTVKYVNAVHSSTLPNEKSGGNPGGFLVMTEEGNFYFAGDTALTMDMKLIPLWCKLDFAMLPIGDNFTMSVDDAFIASDFIECNKIIGMHYDTFGFIKIEHEVSKSKFTKAGKELMLMTIGESISMN